MANGIIGSLLILLKAKSDVQGLVKTDRAMKKTTKTARLLRNVLRGFSLGAIFSGKSTLHDYLEFEKTLGAIHSRFYAITGDSVKANTEFEKVRELSKALGMDMFSLAESYSIFFAGTAKSLGEEGAKSVFESWTKVGRVLHMTPYQMERVTYALREMASKGAIYSQDLRMQIGTHVPNAMGLATQAIKNLNIEGAKTFDDFQKKAKGNQPLINRFIKEFTRLAELQFASPEAMREALKQPDALAGLIKAYRQDFMIEFSRRGGNEVVLTLLNATLDMMRSIDFSSIANMLGVLVKILGNLTSVLIKYLPQLISLLTILTISKLIRGIGAKIPETMFKLGSILLASSMGGSKLAPKIVSTSVKSVLPSAGRTLFTNIIKPLLGALLRMLGGPVTLIVSAIAGLLFIGKKIWDKWNKSKHTGTREEALSHRDYLQNMVKNSNFTVDQLRDTLKDQYMLVDGAKVTFTVDNQKNIVINGLPSEEKEKTSKLFEEAQARIDKQNKKDLEQSMGIFKKTIDKSLTSRR